jgi:putative membrane protein
MTRYKLFLLLAFFAVWLWAAIHPLDIEGWFLENILVIIFVPLIILMGRYLKLSDTSYTLITIFMILHVIGSHYTYAEVPFGFTLQDWFHQPRNMYDRVVHFSFGFLLAYPAREVFVRLSRVGGFWAYYFPLDLVGFLSAVYEIIEWITARLVDPAAGLAFLGTQGDVWDAQKDMFLAICGATLAMLIIFIINWVFNKAHWKEIKESFRIPLGDRPLGEEKLREYIHNKRKSVRSQN